MRHPSRNKNICTQMEMICLRLGSWGSTIVQYHEEAGECTLVLKGTLEYHIEGYRLYPEKRQYLCAAKRRIISCIILRMKT